MKSLLFTFEKLFSLLMLKIFNVFNLFNLFNIFNIYKNLKNVRILKIGVAIIFIDGFLFYHSNIMAASSEKIESPALSAIEEPIKFSIPYQSPASQATGNTQLHIKLHTHFQEAETKTEKDKENIEKWHQEVVINPRFNLDFLKKSLKQYALNEYLNQQESTIQAAKKFIAQQLKDQKNTKPAVVLDIDETSLSNYSSILHNDFAYIKKGGCYYPEGICDWNAWKAKAIAPAVLPTLDLYKWLLTQKVAVFFITGRDEADQTVTEKNLNFSGFENFTGIYFRPNHGFKNVVEYKQNMRAQIEKKGYQILANIGDQETDLAGGFAKQTFKMPNPFYYIQ